jgi:regulator of sigma E protease
MLDERVRFGCAGASAILGISTAKPCGSARLSSARDRIANFLFASSCLLAGFYCRRSNSFRPVVGRNHRLSRLPRTLKVSPGMELKSVGGIETPDWDSVRLALVGEDRRQHKPTLGVARRLVLHQVVTENPVDLRQWTFRAGQRKIPWWRWVLFRAARRQNLSLPEVQSGSAAQKAGLQAGDRIVKVDGQLLASLA